MTNFFAQTPVITKDAGDTHRHAMTQPNVYWTLEGQYFAVPGLKDAPGTPVKLVDTFTLDLKAHKLIL